MPRAARGTSLLLALALGGCFVLPRRPRAPQAAQAAQAIDVEVEPTSFSVVVGGFEAQPLQKVAVITGASTGIGLATVEGLVTSGQYSTVIMAGRDLQKHQDAMEALRERMPNLTQPVELRYMPLDLASFTSVRSFKDAFDELQLKVDTLILNAGVMALPSKKRTEDGYEYQFGVNHLGHFLLANLLMDKLVERGTETEPSRVIALSSSAHQIPTKLLKGDLGDLQSEEYTPWGAYGQSKLANLLFAYELDRRLRAKGLPVTANAVHPGVVNTELFRYAGPEPDPFGLIPVQNLTKPLLRYVLKSPEDGAKTSLVLATQPEGKLSGRYWQDGRPTASADFDPLSDLPAAAQELLPFKPKLTSYDPKIWKELWDESQVLVGLRPEDVTSL